MQRLTQWTSGSVSTRSSRRGRTRAGAGVAWAAASSVSMMLAAGALAGTDTWTGNTSNLWNNAGNWSSLPVAGDSLVFAGSNNAATSSNDFANQTLFNGFTFDGTAGAFTLSGNSVLLGAGSGGAIVNNSSNLQTMTLGLTLSNLSTAAPFGGNHLINGGTAGIALNPTGGLARTIGSSADFAGTLSTTTITNDSTGIIGGWATFGASTSTSGLTFGTDLAAVVGGQIVAYTGYNNITGAAAIASTPGTNYKWSGSTTPGTLVAAGTTDFNSLTYADSTAATINMTTGQIIRVGTTGTIFRSSGASDTGLQIGNTAGTGTLTAGGPNANTAGELVLDANSLNDPNPGITVDAIIADNGTGKVTLVKTGMGAVVLQPGVANTFTGDIYINQGKLRDQTVGAFGKGANIYVYNGGQAYFQTSDTVTQHIFLSGQGVSEGGSFLGGAMRLAGNGMLLSGPITLTGDTRITARGATAAGGTISGQISGGFNLELGGATTGIFILSNSTNSWTGNTTISSGTTRLGANEALPSGAGKGNVIINGDGNGGGATTLDLNAKTQTINGLTLGATTATASITNTTGVATLNVGANNATSQYDGVFTTSAGATLNLNKVGSGTFTLTNGSAGGFTGTITSTAGTLALSSSAGVSTANLATSGGVNGGRLDVTAFSGGGFNLSGGQTLTSNSSGTGGVAGSVNVGGGSLLSGTGSVGSGTDVVNLNGGGIHPGANAGDGVVGTLTLSNLNASSGDIRIDASGAGDKIAVTGTAAFSGGTITVAAGAQAGTYTILTAGTLTGGPSQPTLSATTLGRSTFSLDFSTANAIKLTVVGQAANLRWNNTGAGGGDGSNWDIQSNKNWANLSTPALTPDQYFEADNVTFNDTNNSHYTVNVSGSVNPGAWVVDNSAGDYVFNGGSVNGITGLTKTGTRTLTLNNANNFTGVTALNGGTLILNNNNALGTGALSVAAGTTLGTPGGVQLANNNAIGIGGSFTEAGPGDFNAGTGAVTINAANPTITVSAGTLTFGGVVGNGTGTTGFTKAGVGALALPVANTYTGATTISAGKVSVGNFAALGPTASLGAVTIANGGELEITSAITLNTAGGFGAKVFTVAGTGVDGNGVIQNNGNNQQNAFQKVTLSGAASFGGSARWDIRGGTPTLDLAGFNLTKVGGNQISLVGTTIKNTGVGPNTIEVTSGFMSLEAAANTPGTNGSFLIDANIPLQFFGVTGAVTWPITLAGNNAVGNSTTTAATIASPITIKGNVTLEPLAAGNASLASNFPLTLSGSIGESGGSFSVTKQGTVQTLTLSGTNTYSGGTQLQAGTLKAGSAGVLPSTGTVSFSDGSNDAATLDLNGFNVTVGGLSNAGGGTATIGNSSTTANGTITHANGTSTFSGIIQDVIGAGTKTTALTLAGGSLTLTAANTYTGNTTVNSGATLVLDTAASIAATNNVTANGALVSNQGSQTIASLNGASTGSLVLNGTALTIANGGTFAGNWNDGATASSITASGGTLALNGATSPNSTVNANVAVNFGGTTGIVTTTRLLTALNIAASTPVKLTHSTFPFTPTVLKPTNTSFGGGSTLDITNNAFVTTGTAAGALTQLQSGQIFSSEPADPNHAIGYINLSGADTGKFEVRYTLKGDTNLDGQVDVGDLGALATSYGITGGMSWANGDFNRDHNVDVGDLGALATNYGTHLASGPAAGGGALSLASPAASVAGGGASVPEPASLTVIGIGATSLLSRRRRRRPHD